MDVGDNNPIFNNKKMLRVCRTGLTPKG